MDTGAANGKAADAGDLLQVMDLAQEEIARNLGEGHRVIHGVAGSGKTLILAYRCQYLARTLQKPILVLVFNRSLAAWLQHQFDAQGFDDNRVKVLKRRCYGIFTVRSLFPRLTLDLHGYQLFGHT